MKIVAYANQADIENLTMEGKDLSLAKIARPEYGMKLPLYADIPEADMSIVELDLTDEELLRIAMMAHEKDITFNQMIGLMLENVLENVLGDPELPLGDL